MDATISFVLQGLLVLLMMFFGIILNGMRMSMDQIRSDLKTLNDAVLGKYALREDIDKWREIHVKEQSNKWEAYLIEVARQKEDQRKLDHDMRDHIQNMEIRLAKMTGKYQDITLTKEQQDAL